MEAFSRLVWDGPVEEDKINFFEKDVFERTSAAFHQIYEIRQSPWPDTNVESTDPVKDQSGDLEWDPVRLKREKIDVVKGQGKVIKIQLPKPFRNVSVLSAKDQKDYVHILLRVMKSIQSERSHDHEEMLKFKEFQEKLQKEYHEFQMFAQEIVNQKPLIYSFMPTPISEYAVAFWMNQLSRVKSYPPLFKGKASITLIPKENVTTCELLLEKTVLEIGQVPRMLFPPMNSTLRFFRNPRKFSSCYPPDAEPTTPVSKDANAIKIAKKYQVDFVMSSSTLKALAGNIGPLFREVWEIPITVSEEITQGGTKKIMYLDKPLPPKEMSAVDKHYVFNKSTAKYQLTKKGRTYVYPGSVAPKKVKCDDLFGSEEADLSDLETFGIDADTKASKSPPKSATAVQPIVQKPPSPSKQETPKLKSDTESSMFSEAESECSLVIDLGESPPKPKNPPSRIMTRSSTKRARASLAAESESASDQSESKSARTESKPSQSQPVPNLLSSILENQEKMMQETKKKPKVDPDVPEDPRNYFPLDRNGINFTYRIWNFKVKDEQMRLLIRTSVDGVVENVKESRTFLIVPKLEYQPWFGAETLPVREMFQEWIDCHVRPGCRVFRARLDVYTGDLMFGEQRDASFLAADSKFHYGPKCQPSTCLQNVWAPLSSLRDLHLDPGSYLIQHGRYDGICAQVLERVDDPKLATYNLHETYGKIDPNVNTEPPVSEQWKPLDPWTVLPVQRVLGRPPATFEPRKEPKTYPKKKKKTTKTQVGASK